MIPKFKVNFSVDLKVIGDFPQVQEFSRTQPGNPPLYPIMNEYGRLSSNTLYPIYRMQSKALLTDLMSNIPLGKPLMISKNCYGAINILSIPENQVFPLKFIQNGNIIDSYYAFSLVFNRNYLESNISWKHSRFYLTKDYHRILIKEYTFESFEDWKKMKKEVDEEGEFGFLADTKIKYNGDFDIINFGLYPLPSDYLCTERFVDIILSNSLTGFEFEPLPNNLFVFD
jgi:hypothetical protein